MQWLCQSLSEPGKLNVSLDYRRDYSPTVNSEAYVDSCRAAAADVVGRDRVSATPAPSMAAEDFSEMLQAKPGCYVWLGNGPADNGRHLHSSQYDFNDSIWAAGRAIGLGSSSDCCQRRDSLARHATPWLAQYS